MPVLTGSSIKNSYKRLIQVGRSDNDGIDATSRPLQDGNGNNIPLEVSTSTVRVTVAPLSANDVATKSYVDNNLGIININYSANINTNALAGRHALVNTLTGNTILENPSNPTDGKKIEWRFIADSSDRSITFGSKFLFPSLGSVSSPLTLPANQVGFFLAEYVLSIDKWKVLSWLY